LHLLADDVVAELDALVAHIDGGAGDELADLMLALAAERAIQQLAVFALAARFFRHLVSPPCPALPGGVAYTMGVATPAFNRPRRGRGSCRFRPPSRAPDACPAPCR